jgi:hypothetical protein
MNSTSRTKGEGGKRLERLLVVKLSYCSVQRKVHRDTERVGLAIGVRSGTLRTTEPAIHSNKHCAVLHRAFGGTQNGVLLKPFGGLAQLAHDAPPVIHSIAHFKFTHFLSCNLCGQL